LRRRGRRWARGLGRLSKTFRSCQDLSFRHPPLPP
jgi:hypothetical protein